MIVWENHRNVKLARYFMHDGRLQDQGDDSDNTKQKEKDPVNLEGPATEKPEDPNDEPIIFVI